MASLMGMQRMEVPHGGGSVNAELNGRQRCKNGIIELLAELEFSS